MQLQHCSDHIQQAFYRELSLSSQTPETSQPLVEKKRGRVSVLAAIKYSLGGTLFLTTQALACQVITEVTAFVNLQHVMYF